MSNLLKLLMVALATFGFWVLSSAYILPAVLGPRGSYRLYLGMVSLPDILLAGLFGAWAILVARMSPSLFSGSSARRYCVAATLLVVLLFFYARGMFIRLNFGGHFFSRQLVLGLIVGGAAWYGLRTPASNRRN